MEIVYSENSTNKLFISNDHPEGPPDWYLARVEVDRGGHKVLVEEVLRKDLFRMLFRLEAIILHSYYTFKIITWQTCAASIPLTQSNLSQRNFSASKLVLRISSSGTLSTWLRIYS